MNVPTTLTETSTAHRSWFTHMAALAEGLYYAGHGSESEDILTPVYIDYRLDDMSPAALLPPLQTTLEVQANYQVDRCEPRPSLLDPSRTFAADSPFGDAGAERALAINDIAARELHDFHSVILIGDADGCEHAQFLIGRTQDGYIAGFRTTVVWT